MNEIIDFLQKSSPLIGAILVPLAGIWVKLSSGRQDPYAIRQMKRHAELHEKLPEAGRLAIAELLKFESRRYASAIVRRSTRKFNGPNFAAMVFVGVATGVVVYLTMTWGFLWWGGFVIAALAAIIGIAFLLVGLQQMFLYEADAEDEDPGTVEPATVADTTATHTEENVLTTSGSGGQGS